MSRECKKCGDTIPISIFIEGVNRYLLNRKYCLKCSPFGKHNTASLEKYTKGYVSVDKNGGIKKQRVCPRCDKKHFSKSFKCAACIFKERKKNRVKKIYDIVGHNCWVCDYGEGKKSIPILDFHHMHDKTMGLTARELTNFSWEKVRQEIKKCILLCCRCHREIHFGIMEKDIVERKYNEKWKEIIKSFDEISFERKEVLIECQNCKKEFKPANKNTKFCSPECSYTKSRIVKERPTKEGLQKLINELPMVRIGKMFGVSDNAVRKWAKRYGL